MSSSSTRSESPTAAIAASLSNALSNAGEHLAAGFCELTDAAPILRWSRALRRYFENTGLPDYRGEQLYPCGPRVPDRNRQENRILDFCYSFTWTYNEDALERALADASQERRRALESLRGLFRDLDRRAGLPPTEHAVGGWGYTHSIPNYGRVLREGLDSYAGRVESGRERALGDGDKGRCDFYAGMQDLLAGIRCRHGKLLGRLAAWPANTAADSARRDRLIAALERVPFLPARSFF